MPKITLTWDCDTPVDSFEVIRSDTSLESVPDASLPTPIATGVTVKSYDDTTVVTGNAYYYKVRAKRGSLSVVSDQIEVFADKDMYWDSVVSLFHFDDNLNDEKGTVWTVSNSSNIYITDANFKFGKSVRTIGNNSYLSSSYDAKFDLSTSDFTIEAYVYKLGDTGNSLYSALFSKRNGGADWDYGLEIHNNGCYFRYGDTSNASKSMSIGTVLKNQWYHIAITREGSTLRGFIDGQLLATTTISGNIRNRNLPVYLGRSTPSWSDNQWNGYIDEFRLTKGIARYTGNFTPPDKPFPH